MHGTLAATITVAPEAVGDSYSNLVKNTEAYVTGGTTAASTTPAYQLSGKLTANDQSNAAITANAGTFSTANSGSVVIASDGTFKYTPPANNNAASDTFTYTIKSNSVDSAPATVTLNLLNRVWWVNPGNGSDGDGRSNNPWNTSNHISSAGVGGDIFFIFSGNAANLNNDITLLASQQLIGQGVSLVVNSQTLVAAGTKPSLSNSAGNVVAINNGNTIAGVTLTNSSNNLITGAPTSGLTVSTVTMTPSGTANGINLTGGSGTAAFSSVTMTGTSSGDMVKSNTGTHSWTFANSPMTQTTGRAINVTNKTQNGMGCRSIPPRRTPCPRELRTAPLRYRATAARAIHLVLASLL